MNFKNYTVLVLDDSPVVITSTRSMLARCGFNETNIFFSRSPKTGVAMAQRCEYDLFICDYNFQSVLDGRQVFEELRFYHCIKEESPFIVITGDNTVKTVNSLVELSADDYILKPYNMNFFKKRIIAAFRKKKALVEVEKAKRTGNFEAGVDACDQLIPFYPQYYETLMREKGKFLRNLKHWDKAEDFYKELDEKDSYEWVKIGLANTLKNLGKTNEARKVLDEILNKNPDSLEANKEIASLSALNKNIPESIKHLIRLGELTNNCSERDLAISNLSFSVGDHQSSMIYYRRYMDLNKETFRNQAWMKINFIRRLLILVTVSDNKSKYQPEVERLLLEIRNADENSPSFELHVDIISSHLLLLKNQFSEAISLLDESYKLFRKNKQSHFYDVHYICWLLLYFSFDTEFIKMTPQLKETYLSTVNSNYEESTPEIVINSNEVLLESIIDSNNKKSAWLSEKNEKLKSLEGKELLDTYLNITDRYPTLKSIRFKTIKLLSEYWPTSLGRQRVREIVRVSDDLINQTCTKQELKELNYDSYYSKAQKLISSK